MVFKLIRCKRLNARTESGFKLRGPKFFVQEFSNIGTSILEVGNNATYFDFINVGLRLN